jgi:hypothetical protein
MKTALFFVALLGAGCTTQLPDTDAGALDAGETDGGSPDAGRQCPVKGAGPSARSDFAFVSDSDSAQAQLWLYGGDPGFAQNCQSAPQFDGETWHYDVLCSTWSKYPGASPPPRARHTAVWDSKRKRMVIFGGRYRAGASGAYTVFNETWSFEPAALDGQGLWTPLQPTGTLPPGLANAAAVYDAAGDRMLVFGGNTSISGLTFSPENRLWSLDFAANAWSEVTPTTATRPPARQFHAMALDAQRGRLIVFSGGDANAFTGPFLADLWVFDLAARSWSPLAASGTPPMARIRPSLVLDAARDRMLLFGGHDDGQLGERNDLSALALASPAWTTLKLGDTLNQPGNGFCDFPSNFTNADLSSPERREAMGLVQIDPSGSFVLFGGRSDCGVLADLWSFDPAAGSWKNQIPAFAGTSCARSGKLNCTTLCF